MEINTLFSDLLLEENIEKLKDLKIINYVLGLSYVAVETQKGVGLAYTFRSEIKSDCEILNKDLHNKHAEDAAAMINSYDLLESAFGLATINSVLNSGQTEETEIFDNVDFCKKNIGMIGFFRPVVEKLSSIVNNLYIFELKDIPGSYPPEYAKKLLPECDIVIISGTTLINKTAEDFFHYISSASKRIILGPSTPLSEKLSKYADLYGFRVTDNKACLAAIAQGGGMKSLKSCGKKVALTNLS